MRISDWSSDVCSSDLEFVDNIFLASDVAALDAARSGPCGVDWDRLSEFLQTPGIRRRATCLADLEELPPGVLTCFGSDGRSERRLWTPDRKSTRLNSSH